MIRVSLVAVQTFAFFALGVYFVLNGNWRFGVAQVLLAGVNVAVYA